MIKNVLDLVYPVTDADINIVPEIINKPIMISETGLDYGSCDNGIEYMKFVWCTSFTGIAGTGQEWHHQHDLSLIQHNVNLKNFIGTLDFSNNDWQPNYDVRNDLKAAAYYLVSDENKKRAIGVIENRSVNYWSMTTDVNPDSECNKLENLPSNQDPAIEFDALIYNVYGSVSNAGGNNRIQVKGLKPHQKYKVDFYSIFSSGWLDSDVKKANGQGELTLNYPTLNSDETPIVAFKVRENGEANFTQPFDTIYVHDLPEELNQENIEELSQLTLTNWDKDSLSFEFTVDPNPTNGLVNINCIYEENLKLSVYDSKNNLLLSDEINCNNKSVDISAFPAGVYYFILIKDGKHSTQKILKL